MTIHLERGEQIATITIDRTHRRNALDLASLEDLHAAVVRCVADGTRAIVLTGADGHFCAGADLTELEDVSFTTRLAQVLAHLAAVPVTTVAAIEGWRYDPTTLATGDCVDRLSLYLALRDTADERVRKELRTLLADSRIESVGRSGDDA